MDQLRTQESIGRDVSHLFRSIRNFMGRQLEPYGIGDAQFPFLMLLLHEDGISQEYLATALKCDRATSARSTARLEDAGYVRRVVDPDDKRAYKVFLTEQGHDMRQIVWSVSSDLNDMLLEGFTDEEKLAFRNMIKKAGINISKCNQNRKTTNE
ncbi:MarR family winged helix-turn-helix transcriptional regulator [uncultured Methanomethylovorans sp.]|uniref:MarR family winged helix-turn-helix transcriptional regulator n=1 Tax=uncultured Methanomethylovorans sp. TaxID=183759 RepID=UPI002AA8DA7A|nr:MarR family winged helix-turn-helix transcriptional regulator [uncultured Methanomethylovorans sp.]